MSNGIFVHVRDSGHVIDWSNTKKIVNSNSVVERNIIESSLIKHSFEDNMNLSLGLYKLDDFIIKKIVNSSASPGEFSLAHGHNRSSS